MFGKPLGHAGEHQLRRGERRVEEEADERHQPVPLHRLDADRIGRMNVEDGAEIVRELVQRLEALVGQRDAVHVAEQHRAGHAELRHGALELFTDAAGSLSGSVASAVKWRPRVSIASRTRR